MCKRYAVMEEKNVLSILHFFFQECVKFCIMDCLLAYYCARAEVSGCLREFSLSSVNEVFFFLFFLEGK